MFIIIELATGKNKGDDVSIVKSVLNVCFVESSVFMMFCVLSLQNKDRILQFAVVDVF